MLFMEIIAAYSETHKKHMNIICGHNAEALKVKAGGTYTCHCI
jgi:hypothetical protein